MNIENSKRGDFKEEGCYSVNGTGKLGEKTKKNLSAPDRTRM